MTPTEQDNELRKAILLEFKNVHRLAPADYTENCTNVVMRLITADRKRVALEAGIEAVKQYNRVLTDNLPPKPEYTAIGLDGIVAVYRQVEIGEAVRKANNQCIAELKAQQEEV